MTWRRILQMAIEIANQAVEEDNKKNHKEALMLYDKSKGYFLHCLELISKIEGTRGAQKSIRAKASIYEKRADFLRIYFTKKEIKQTNSGLQE